MEEKKSIDLIEKRERGQKKRGETLQELKAHPIRPYDDWLCSNQVFI